jgi:hypothetical protein
MELRVDLMVMELHKAGGAAQAVVMAQMESIN